MLAREKNNVQKEEEGPSKENGSHNLRLVGPISDINDDDKEDSSHDPCAICLNDYEDGDAICWSHNTHCSHVFHRQCISEWLLTHEECPCCRHAYLCFNDDEQDPTEESASTENSSVQPVHVPAVVMRDGYLSDDDNAALARGWQLFYNLTRRTTPPSTPQTVEHYATSFDRTRDKLEGVDTADDGPIGVEVANAASDETFAFDLPPASVPTETR